MSRALSVKVATHKVVAALENKLAQVTKDYASQEANEANYQKAREEWQEEIGKWAIGNILKAENIKVNYRSWNRTLNVDFDITTGESDFPAEPQKDHNTIHPHTYKAIVEEIQNAINILKMTEDEFVSTSTMKAISQYL